MRDAKAQPSQRRTNLLLSQAYLTARQLVDSWNT